MNPIDQNRLLQMRSAIVAQNQALQRAAGLDTPQQTNSAPSFTQALSDAVRAVDAQQAKPSGQDITLAMIEAAPGYEARAQLVRAFVQQDPERAAHIVRHLMQERVVATTADEAPLLRIKAAMRATAIAEYFRALGKRVLLLLDSLTRIAHAQREIGLALGEPPAMKGYPPSALGLIPQLVERAGNERRSGGSITAIYTVLADGGELDDPVVGGARGFLSGAAGETICDAGRKTQCLQGDAILP